MNLLSQWSFQKRVVVAFLVVPWFPLLIFFPYAPSTTFRLFGWDMPYNHLLLCAVIAAFTYILEVTVLIPAWLWMLRSGKVSLLRVLLFAFVVALACIVVFLRILFGPDFLLISELAWLIPLVCFVGSAEALFFWLIVRPDRRKTRDNIQKFNKDNKDNTATT
jgi:hypothetical protein